jgi:hypothetical protein
MAHTYAVLQVSAAAYNEVRRLLEDAGYGHAFHQDDDRVLIDMHGIALSKDAADSAYGLVYPARDGRDGWILETPAGKLYCRSRSHASAELALYLDGPRPDLLQRQELAGLPT